jgi:hypothetical protein
MHTFLSFLFLTLAAVVSVVRGPTEDGLTFAIAPFVLPLIGAGLGFASSFFGPKNQTSTSTTTLDPATQRWLEQYRQQAFQNYQNSGALNPYAQSAYDRFSQGAGGLNFGMRTGLGGLDEYMNPYLQDVIGSTQGDFDRLRGQALTRSAQEATSRGAFGGSRSGILQAMSLDDVGRREASTLADLRYKGYQSAVEQMMAERERMLGVGQWGGEGMAGIGKDFDANRRAAMEAMGFGLTFGGSSTRSSTPIYRNPIAGALGGASLGLSMGGGGTQRAFIPDFAATMPGPVQWPRFGSSARFGFGG